jgi:hypothetical protein
MNNALRSLIALAALFALTGLAYRLARGRGSAEEAATESAAARRESPAPVTERRQPRRLALAAPAAPQPPREASTQEQADAIREAVVRDTVQTIQLAARRGDTTTARGLASGLKARKRSARAALDEALRAEEDADARRILLDVRAQLD